jgi:RNA polymerase sigma-70 factor (ECF subfamily)
MSRFLFGKGKAGAALPMGEPPSQARDALAEARVRELVDRSVEGDAEAFGGLYDLFCDGVYRYFFHHTGNAADAEDLLSRTFLRAWRAIPSFKWRGKPFEAWLFTLARNQLIDFYRERRRVHEPLDESRPDSRPGPESRAIAVAEATATRAALAKLTEEQRQVLVLKFYLDYETREIAAIMGKREGTVRALQMRALQALRRHLQDE